MKILRHATLTLSLCAFGPAMAADTCSTLFSPHGDDIAKVCIEDEQGKITPLGTETVLINFFEMGEQSTDGSIAIYDVVTSAFTGGSIKAEDWTKALIRVRKDAGQVITELEKTTVNNKKTVTLERQGPDGAIGFISLVETPSFILYFETEAPESQLKPKLRALHNGKLSQLKFSQKVGKETDEN